MICELAEYFNSFSGIRVDMVLLGKTDKFYEVTDGIELIEPAFNFNNKFRFPVVVIGDKAYANKRLARRGDFRASGSGNILYEKNLFDENTIELSFRLATKLKS